VSRKETALSPFSPLFFFPLQTFLKNLFPFSPSPLQ
jgi:hypothetical protein